MPITQSARYLRRTASDLDIEDAIANAAPGWTEWFVDVSDSEDDTYPVVTYHDNGKRLVPVDSPDGWTRYRITHVEVV